MTDALVLVVEDNLKSLQLVCDLLQVRGYQTLEATTASLGIDLARARQPDLILMDIQLPDFDGVTALKRLRADPVTVKTPVIALTAFAMVDDEQRFLDAGFDGYMTKPIDTRTFVDSMAGYLLTPRPPNQARKPAILVVDDTPQNGRLLEALLTANGYVAVLASSGPEALELIPTAQPSLVLLDVMMPRMDGYEVCRRLRADPATRLLPVVMMTASEEPEKVRAIEVGADDFIVHPINQSELLARVRSLLRIKEYYDENQAQAAELAEWNRTLEQRVADQVQEIERANRLRRFLPPQLADLMGSSGDDSILESHRREITLMFCGLHGFTAFAETAEPEDVMQVLREFHDVAGATIFHYEGTTGRFAGDSLMVFFNDPFPCPDGPERAVRMALDMRQQVGRLAKSWRSSFRYPLNFGAGIAMGYATLGKIGFEGRYDYGAIGAVAHLGWRLYDESTEGQILLTWWRPSRWASCPCAGLSVPHPRSA
ncbi:MAG: response regulator [Chloroflexi bacterium]|nr:response regulator [Chloroflexota bacterium]